MLLVLTAGCQCCPLTDHYASAVDCIADHEHGLDVLYTPCLDLTRIGRPDWCQCRVNRWICPCRCERCKPLPHIVDTTAAAYVGVHCPWADEAAATPIDGNQEPPSAESLPTPTAAESPSLETDVDVDANWSLDR